MRLRTSWLIPTAALALVASQLSFQLLAQQAKRQAASGSATQAAAPIPEAPPIAPGPHEGENKNNGVEAEQGKKTRPYDGPCRYKFNDCDWEYSLLGGVEQSAVSAEDSQNSAFADLFVRAPFNMRWGSVWLRARFLGAPTQSDTFNVQSAITNADGTLGSTALSQVGKAVDYKIGLEHDFWLARDGHPDSMSS